MFIRTVLAALCVATACTLSAHPPSPAQSPISTTDPCYVLRAVVDLSQWTGATMGFEEEPSDCWRTSAPAGVHGDPPPSDIRDLLDQLIVRAPSYVWREMDGVFVVRPVAAWKDTGHFLHGRVGSFTAREADLTMAVSTLSDAVRPRHFVPWVDLESLRSGIRLDQRLHRGAPLKGPPFAVSFQGGSLLDAPTPSCAVIGPSVGCSIIAMATQRSTTPS